MPDRENSDAATPLSGKAVRWLGRPGSWLHREAVVVSLCTLLGVTPAWVAAGPDDHRLSLRPAPSNVDPGKMLERVQDAPRLMQLYAVNGYFNTFGYRSDLELWELPDHWASPRSSWHDAPATARTSPLRSTSRSVLLGLPTTNFSSPMCSTAR